MWRELLRWPASHSWKNAWRSYRSFARRTSFRRPEHPSTHDPKTLTGLLQQFGRDLPFVVLDLPNQAQAPQTTAVLLAKTSRWPSRQDPEIGVENRIRHLKHRFYTEHGDD